MRPTMADIIIADKATIGVLLNNGAKNCSVRAIRIACTTFVMAVLHPAL